MVVLLLTGCTVIKPGESGVLPTVSSGTSGIMLNLNK